MWSITDTDVHLVRDICVGLGEPLQGLVIIRHAAGQSEILMIVVAPIFRRLGLALIHLSTGEKRCPGRG
ncbi:MAG: hypothetical protein GDA39_10425 [Hyphomonadaceae bacterium]|nr:hypothetical protein [Hyphomonadaceae bacterium]MBC6413239.1 hypothetical protein [Hyphomonadaceae bacterium]